MGTPVTLIGEAVFARCLSSIKDERTRASKVLTGPKPQYTGDKAKFIEDIRQVYSRTLDITGYKFNVAIGTVCIQDHLIRSRVHATARSCKRIQVASQHGWYRPHVERRMHHSKVCVSEHFTQMVILIVSFDSVFLGNIRDAYLQNPELECLLFDKFFSSAIDKAQASWRRVVSQAALVGIPTPAFSTALSFYDGYRREVVPANLLQAQRDYFGAHTVRISFRQ